MLQMSYCFLFLLGIFFGWLANAISYKFIIEEDLFSAFKCPYCQTKLTFLDLIPIISYFFICVLRCRHCNRRISKLYPLMEFLCGILFVVVFARFGFNARSLMLLFCLYIVFVCVVIDIETLTVPDIFLYLLLIISTIYSCLYSSNPVIILGLSLSIFFLLIGVGRFMSKILKRQSIGFGDVILIPVLTNFLNQDTIPIFIMLSGIIGLFFGLFWQYYLGFGKKFPFIPPIFAAFFACVLYVG